MVHSMSLFLFLLFVAIPIAAEKKCLVTLETLGTIKPERLQIPGFDFYFCKDDALIYSTRNNLQVEYSIVRCNLETGQWEAIESDVKQHEYKKIVFKGNLNCKGTTKISCENTRFDFDDLSLDSSNSDWQDPKYDERERSYKCEGGYHLYIKRKFTHAVRAGFYLRSNSVECKGGQLTARFAHEREPQAVDHRDTVTCKKFQCDDTQQHSLSYFNVLKMNTECPDGSCRKPDFFDERSPCGEEGHELTVAERDTQTWHWLKDNYLDCRDGNKLIYTDIHGERRRIREGDRIVCQLPTSCPRLMTHGMFGCDGRYDCYEIDPSTIPTHHLSLFDGNCHSGHVLKVFNIKSEYEEFLTELDYIECRNGEWFPHLLPESISNKKNGITKEQVTIDPSTNLVCKRRVDFTECHIPPFKCPPTTLTEKAMCSSVIVNGLKIECDKLNDAVPVTYTIYSDGREEVTEVSHLVCDRGSGKWTEKKFPYNGLWEEQERRTYAVCARTGCSRALKPQSDCGRRSACEPIDLDTKYWTKRFCPPFYEMKLQKGGIGSTYEIADSFLCHPESNEWTLMKGEKKILLSTEDNIFCQEKGVLDVVEDTLDDLNHQVFKGRESSPDTSPECLPTKLDSICPEIRLSCERVTQKDSEWKCEGEKQLWYIEYSKYSEEAVKADSLKCRERYWRVFARAAEIIPNPHSNFVCLSPEEQYSDVFEGATGMKKQRVDSKGDEKTEEKESEWWHFTWRIPTVETVAIFTSLGLMVAASCLAVYAHRKGEELRESD